ncbi:MAG: S9 family peptidase [Anaerolineae bacterium]|nr:S9 family peptidase [Anaerolineae bacterium]
MDKPAKLTEKYEHRGWPSLARPDMKPPPGWSLSLITSIERIRHHALSPDGQTIAFIKDGETLSDVYTLAVSGGWPQRISTDRALVAYWEGDVPQWSPDGRWLAFTKDNHVYLAPAAGGLPQKITDFATGASAPKWMPDSYGLIVSVERYEADQLVLTDRAGGWPRALTNSGDGNHWHAQPSPDGTMVAFIFQPFDDLNRLDLRLIDLANDQIRLLHGRPKVRMWLPRWSPDGQWLAFISQQAGYDDLWLIRPNEEGLRQLTKLGYDISDPAWSPDGKHIACTVNRGGAIDLALVEVNTGRVTDLRSGPGVHSYPRWSPDGSFLTFEYESPLQPPDIYRLDLAAGQVKPLTFSQSPTLAGNELVLPKRVAYQSNDGLEIPAFLYHPPQPNGAAILYPHGGPSAQYLLEWDILAQYLVAKGYTFLAPNYRGSTGYGVDFERANYNDWGQGDMQDCLYGAKYLRSLPGLDPARLAIMGPSYGGYLTICCLSRDPEYLFACGIAKYGDANLISSWAQCKRELRLYIETFLGHPAQNRQVYLEGSPLYDVQNVKKPMFILHGLLDKVVAPEASEEWVEALKRYGKTFEYKTYANEAHGLLRRANQLDAYTRIERFLDWYLLP